MTFQYQRLFHTIARLNESVLTPPWPLEVWNPDAQQWQAVCTVAGGVLYEYGPNGLEFVLTSEGNVIGDAS